MNKLLATTALIALIAGSSLAQAQTSTGATPATNAPVAATVPAPAAVSDSSKSVGGETKKTEDGVKSESTKTVDGVKANETKLDKKAENTGKKLHHHKKIDETTKVSAPAVTPAQ